MTQKVRIATGWSDYELEKIVNAIIEEEAKIGFVVEKIFSLSTAEVHDTGEDTKECSVSIALLFRLQISNF